LLYGFAFACVINSIGAWIFAWWYGRWYCRHWQWVQ
jgi:hypothetical protein